MFKPIKLRTLGGACAVAVLLCAGLYYYIQWDDKRFMAEIRKPPAFTTASEPTVEPQNNQTQAVEQTTSIDPVEFVTEPAGAPELGLTQEPEPTDEEASVPQADTSKATSEFDPTPLLSAFGLPDEVTALFDEEVVAEDIEAAETHLIETYGQSPEAEEIVDKLKQLSGRPVELSDLIELFEAWIQVLPEEDQENRRQLMEALTKLNQIKRTGQNNPVGIKVDVIEEVKVIDATDLDD